MGTSRVGDEPGGRRLGYTMLTGKGAALVIGAVATVPLRRLMPTRGLALSSRVLGMACFRWKPRHRVHA